MAAPQPVMRSVPDLYRPPWQGRRRKILADRAAPAGSVEYRHWFCSVSTAEAAGLTVACLAIGASWPAELRGFLSGRWRSGLISKPASGRSHPEEIQPTTCRLIFHMWSAFYGSHRPAARLARHFTVCPRSSCCKTISIIAARRAVFEGVRNASAGPGTSRAIRQKCWMLPGRLRIGPSSHTAIWVILSRVAAQVVVVPHLIPVGDVAVSISRPGEQHPLGFCWHPDAARAGVSSSGWSGLNRQGTTEFYHLAAPREFKHIQFHSFVEMVEAMTEPFDGRVDIFLCPPRPKPTAIPGGNADG